MFCPAARPWSCASSSCVLALLTTSCTPRSFTYRSSSRSRREPPSPDPAEILLSTLMLTSRTLSFLTWMLKSSPTGSAFSDPTLVLVFSMHVSHRLPSTLSLHGHWPVSVSHWSDREPVGSQSQGCAPSTENPK